MQKYAKTSIIVVFWQLKQTDDDCMVYSLNFFMHVYKLYIYIFCTLLCAFLMKVLGGPKRCIL